MFRGFFPYGVWQTSSTDPIGNVLRHMWHCCCCLGSVRRQLICEQQIRDKSKVSFTLVQTLRCVGLLPHPVWLKIALFWCLFRDRINLRFRADLWRDMSETVYSVTVKVLQPNCNDSGPNNEFGLEQFCNISVKILVLCCFEPSFISFLAKFSFPYNPS